MFHRGNSTYLPEPVEGKEEGVAQDLFLPPTQTRQLVNNLRTGKVEGTAWEKREGSFHTPQTQDREGRGDSLGEERGIIPHTPDSGQGR